MMDQALVQESQRARPILKWAGGKTQLLSELIKRLPSDFANYHEPFVGGGALFFELSARERMEQVYLSDVNPSLIDVYTAVRDEVDEVIRILKTHPHDSDYYYALRAQQSDRLPLAERAARIIYLNKTCYNGLYRENRKGEFNVPFGRYKRPTICDEPNLQAASRVLQSVDLSTRPYETVLDVALPGDLVYFDPPYHPLSTTSNFTSYARDGFGKDDQQRLCDVFTDLAKRGVLVLLSNSDTPFIRKLYSDFSIDQVFATRSVNSKANGRGKISEVLVRSFSLQ